ncbi:MAG: hypothetical protein MR314_00640 [Ezakiella sp.]|nr:hypothetical protein [Ezakiella sp.]
MDRKEFDEICKLARLKSDTEDFYERFLDALSVLQTVNDFDGEYIAKYNINDCEQEPSDDLPKEGITKDEALLNAKRKNYGYFEIDRYVGE